MSGCAIVRAVRLSLIALFALFALAGCASDVGPTGLAIGGPCADVYDCASGSFCLRGAAFPDGTCTTNCGSDADCRGGSVCIEQSAGVCLLPCTTDDDCGREGYVCAERGRHGENGRASVCTGG